MSAATSRVEANFMSFDLFVSGRAGDGASKGLVAWGC
jgi:hypothetical protein